MGPSSAAGEAPFTSRAREALAELPGSGRSDQRFRPVSPANRLSGGFRCCRSRGQAHSQRLSAGRTADELARRRQIQRAIPSLLPNRRRAREAPGEEAGCRKRERRGFTPRTTPHGDSLLARVPSLWPSPARTTALFASSGLVAPSAGNNGLAALGIAEMRLGRQRLVRGAPASRLLRMSETRFRATRSHATRWSNSSRKCAWPSERRQKEWRSPRRTRRRPISSTRSRPDARRRRNVPPPLRLCTMRLAERGTIIVARRRGSIPPVLPDQWTK